MSSDGQLSEKTRRRGGRAARLSEIPDGEPLIERGDPNYTKSATPERVCVIACGAIAHEILDIVKLNALDHIALTCLPAKLHNNPKKITGEVERAIHKARAAGFETIYCGYADCGTGGELDRLLEHEKVDRLPGAHCYAFFTGVEAFSKNDEITAFYLTDFLARHFDGLTYGPLGIKDHPELRDIYFGNYEKVVYLSQREDADLLERAKAIADKLNLTFEHRHTGYGDLIPSLKNCD